MALVILHDTDQVFLERLERVLVDNYGLETAREADAAHAATTALERDASVVVYGPNSIREDVFAAAERVVADAGSRTANLLIWPEVDADLLRAAMRAGFRDVVSSTGAKYGDLAEAVAESERASAGSRGITDSAETASKVITVFSTKGGVGKSVLACNLASYIASKLDKSVILLDLDLEFGDDAVMLGLEPRLTIYDAMNAYERLDAQLLEGYMQTHQSGARVLLAPTHPEQAEAITTARVSVVIELARELADIVIIDTPGRLDDLVLTAIDHSDLVLAIATMDLPSIKNTKVSLQKLRQLHYSDGLVRLVLNRADSKVFLEPSDVEKAVENSVLARIPSDRLVPRSVNRGIPVALDQPKSPVGKSLAELARVVAAS